MWRVVTSTFAALTLFSTVAAAQQPCTTDANRVVAEVYRHTLERGADPGAQTWSRQLANGSLTVKELVRRVAKSQEHMQRFGQTEPGEGQPYERAVARMYRHILARQPDAGGQRNWARTAQQSGLGAVVDGLVDSAEYNNNFGEWGVPGSGGLRFCTNQQSGNVQGSGDVAAGPLNNRRFQTMDVNNDNVVSRREWRGTVESFRSHDWNNDGVLSGNEVDAGRFRQGRNAEFEDFDRAEDFEWLDANNNNRIEESEWHASVRAFDQLDRNNDGVLSRGEFVRTGAPAIAATTGQRIAVGGDRQWVDTGINVPAGASVTITATGQIKVARDGGQMTAAGVQSGRTEGATLPNAPVGALVARFGDTGAMVIGESRTFRPARGGRLYLGVNDNHFDDNTGQFMVTVDIN